MAGFESGAAACFSHLKNWHREQENEQKIRESSTTTVRGAARGWGGGGNK